MKPCSILYHTQYHHNTLNEGYFNQKAMAYFTVFLIASLLAVCQSYSVMYIENNAYKNMVITIGEHVKEDWRLVHRIKEVFQNGSEFLYKVTRSENIYYILHININTRINHFNCDLGN